MSRRKLTKEDIDGFKTRLSQILKKTKLKQYQFGEKIGVSSGAISQFLSGKRFPNKSTLLLLEAFFNVNLKWLKTGHGEMLMSEKYEGAKGEEKKEGLSD